MSKVRIVRMRNDVVEQWMWASATPWNVRMFTGENGRKLRGSCLIIKGEVNSMRREWEIKENCMVDDVRARRLQIKWKDQMLEYIMAGWWKSMQGSRMDSSKWRPSAVAVPLRMFHRNIRMQIWIKNRLTTTVLSSAGSLTLYAGESGGILSHLSSHSWVERELNTFAKFSMVDCLRCLSLERFLSLDRFRSR